MKKKHILSAAGCMGEKKLNHFIIIQKKLNLQM
jgi:hypothetical protein